MTCLRRLRPDQILDSRSRPVDSDTRAAAGKIVDEVRVEGEAALRRHALRLGDLDAEDAPMIRGADELAAAYATLDPTDRRLLQRTAARIRTFAEAQRACLLPLDLPVDGGRAGHDVAPVARAGCYAPGGRFPLPSSVLMTAVTARAAGVDEVWVASPRPATVTMAAAHVAGADALLAVGGAQAIAALAYGAGAVPAVDVIVGPGNRWVTAAKQLVAGQVGIDMLAGPSELVVVADHTADADTVAADLLAQAEHDPDARPILVTTATDLVDRVDAALVRQLATLPTAGIASAALADGGFAVVCKDLAEAAQVCDRIAPEHVELLVADPEAVAARLQHYGGLFLGRDAAEVLGDYGAGPNHVLPTGGTARFTGGLSVMHFLRVRTWLRMDNAPARASLADDAARLARLEGLEAHARSAELRKRTDTT
jgi:phosphoribosyl-ATP pyrophosphohydrolase/phosphoribosyl-AMP cyclohydrolase/histidinol dehydrogenase